MARFQQQLDKGRRVIATPRASSRVLKAKKLFKLVDHDQQIFPRRQVGLGARPPPSLKCCGGGWFR